MQHKQAQTQETDSGQQTPQLKSCCGLLRLGPRIWTSLRCKGFEAVGMVQQGTLGTLRFSASACCSLFSLSFRSSLSRCCRSSQALRMNEPRLSSRPSPSCGSQNIANLLLSHEALLLQALAELSLPLSVRVRSRNRGAGVSKLLLLQFPFALLDALAPFLALLQQRREVIRQHATAHGTCYLHQGFKSLLSPTLEVPFSQLCLCILLQGGKATLHLNARRSILLALPRCALLSLPEEQCGLSPSCSLYLWSKAPPAIP